MADIPNDIGVPTVAPDVRAPDDLQNIQPKAGAAITDVGQGLTKVNQFWGQVQTDGALNDTMQNVDGIVNHFRSLQGADALNAQASTQQAISDAFQQGRATLHTPDQMLQYDESTRTYQERYINGLVASHADEQAKAHASQVNQDAYGLALNHIGSDPTNDDTFNNGLADARAAAVRTVQAQGNYSDPVAVNQAVEKATQASYKARIASLGVTDPAGALKLADANKDALGLDYAPVADDLRTRATSQQGITAGQNALSGVSGGQPVATGAVAPEQINDAIIGQESGGNPQIQTSTNGAVGMGQIEPATFAMYARPGENIGNPADNLAVSRRITTDLYAKTGGDPQRVAVGYFSGPGNIAPPGSATPWIRDTTDGNGKSVSSYVQDVTNRLGTPGLQSLKANAYQRIYADHSLSPPAQQAALTYVDQQYRNLQTATDANTAARKQASDQAAEGWATKMLQPNANAGDILPGIANDPNLTAEAKLSLSDAAQKHATAGIDPGAASYGPGFYPAFKAILAPVGDPTRISDPSDILRMVGTNGLTLPGAEKLIGVLNTSRRSVDDAAVHTTTQHLMDYAKSHLTFEQEPQVQGDPGIKDPKGMDLFNSQFVPRFQSGLDTWIKDGKSPYEYLSQKNVDGMIAGMRSQSSMAADRMAATSDLPMAKQDTGQDEPTPPPPSSSINANEWNDMMGATPKAKDGNPFTKAAWGATLSLLMSDPATNGPYFDKIFGRQGYSAAAIEQRLNAKPPDMTGVNPDGLVANP